MSLHCNVVENPINNNNNTIITTQNSQIGKIYQ